MNTNNTSDIEKKIEQSDTVAMCAHFSAISRKLDSELEFMRMIARHVLEIKKRALLLSVMDSSEEAADISSLSTQVQACLDDHAITILLEAMDTVSGGDHDIFQTSALKVVWRNSPKPVV